MEDLARCFSDALKTRGADMNTDQPHPDPRIVSMFQEEEIHYRIDKQGDFVISVGHDSVSEKRQCCIRSETFEFEGVELREVYVVGPCFPEEFDFRQAMALLVENTHRLFGAWGLADDGKGNRLAILLANVPVDMDADKLLRILEGMADDARGMEERFTSKSVSRSLDDVHHSIRQVFEGAIVMQGGAAVARNAAHQSKRLSARNRNPK
jgi:hypothetical protein